MCSIKFVLEKLLHNHHDFCCLCYNIIGEADKSYNIDDEIVFNNNDSKILFEILSRLLQCEVITNLSDLVLVCHSCTETAIQTYKFITECTKKITQLWHIIKSFCDYFVNINEEISMCNTLIVCLGSEHIKGHSFNRDVDNASSDILDVLQNVSKIEHNIKIEIEQEGDQDANSSEEKYKANVNKECNDTVKLTDIICDKNDLSSFKCKVCHKTFSRRPNLKKHYYSVHAPKMYKCSMCPKSFGSDILLRTHQNHNHCASVCCIACGKVYSSVYALQIHEKRHKMRYTCQHCGKVYKTKHAFKNHNSNVHEGVLSNTTNFKCDYCGKQYSQKSAIRVHIQFEHGNGKFYECDWCKKKFSSVSLLKEHIITHTKEKRFSCEICKGRFATKMSLLYHTRIHTGERPYQCQYCDTSFLSASRRAIHVKQHHIPVVQECDVCHKKFKLRAYLLRHKLRHLDSTSK